jgi:hypothetical protein
MGVASANWGGLTSVKSDAADRRDPETGSAYVRADTEPGTVAKGRGFALPNAAEGMEPHAVWLLVVGSIGALYLLNRLFKSAMA